RLENSRTALRAQIAMGGRLDVRHHPRGLQLRRQAPTRAYQPSGHRAGADADQHTLGHRPYGFDGVLAAVALYLSVYARGGVTERELAERIQVALAEEILDGLRGLVCDVDLAFLEPAT